MQELFYFLTITLSHDKNEQLFFEVQKFNVFDVYRNFEPFTSRVIGADNELLQYNN